MNECNINLRVNMADNGISIKDLAAELGTAPTYMSRIMGNPLSAIWEGRIGLAIDRIIEKKEKPSNGEYVYIPRDVLDNPVVWKDSDHACVWLYLLLSATPKEIPADFGGSQITLKPGQVITGRKAIAAHTGVNEYKVRRILSNLQQAKRIEQQINNKGTIVTVMEYQCYLRRGAEK